jgi:hypothetical protein
VVAAAQHETRVWVTGSCLVLLYGLASHVIFQSLRNILVGTLSVSFLILAPAALGVLTVSLRPARFQGSWVYAIVAPWVSCAVLGGMILFFRMELWICIVMGLPLFVAISTLSGVGTHLVQQRRRHRYASKSSGVLGVLLLLPFLGSPIEMQVSPPVEVHTVEVAITIQAEPARIWDEFTAVEEIQPQERRLTWFQLAGLPQPVAALLVTQGNERVRYAHYANGLMVVEPVLVWQPYERYVFSVELDPGAELPSELWHAVESEHFDVLEVAFWLEPVTGDEFVLHLSSTYRLSTQLNGYARLWLDFLLSDFQQFILEVIKHRAEGVQLL